jgi:hypothetical protein
MVKITKPKVCTLSLIPFKRTESFRKKTRADTSDIFQKTSNKLEISLIIFELRFIWIHSHVLLYLVFRNHLRIIVFYVHKTLSVSLFIYIYIIYCGLVMLYLNNNFPYNITIQCYSIRIL